MSIKQQKMVLCGLWQKAKPHSKLIKGKTLHLKYKFRLTVAPEPQKNRTKPQPKLTPADTKL